MKTENLLFKIDLEMTLYLMKGNQGNTFLKTGL